MKTKPPPGGFCERPSIAPRMPSQTVVLELPSLTCSEGVKTGHRPDAVGYTSIRGSNGSSQQAPLEVVPGRRVPSGAKGTNNQPYFHHVRPESPIRSFQYDKCQKSGPFWVREVLKWVEKGRLFEVF